MDTYSFTGSFWSTLRTKRDNETRKEKEKELNTTPSKHALVIGGSIAGLLAARVLAKHFEQVTIIERDQYPHDPGHRPGTPQDRQVHVMLLRGQRTLEALFPGLGRKLLAQGAVERDYGPETFYFYGKRCPSSQIPAGVLRGWCCSRLLLEWQLHQELQALPQIIWKEGVEVVQLLSDKHHQRVTGVRCRARNHQEGEQTFLGDLVVDASGASSRISHWLKELGYDAPPETVVNPHLGYATRFYDIPVSEEIAWKGIAIQGTGQNRRGGSLMKIEGRQWIAVLAGTGDDVPPTEPEAFLAFAQSLPEPLLYETIKEAEPLTPIYGYRRTENRLRHFEQISLPDQLVILGDAVCCFNPIYGQGMTVAALEAQTLDVCLQQGPQGIATFQRQVARLLAFPWRLATASDARDVTQSRKGFSQRYIDGLIKLLPQDPKALLTFLEVLHMLRSPRALFSPGLVLKVVREMV